jgi:hypothetical protein
MECFKIDWKGFYTANEARNQAVASGNGVYAIYETGKGKSSSKTPKLWYVGKARQLGNRIRQHEQSLAHRGVKGNYCIGIIYFLKDGRDHSRINSAQLGNVESFLINSRKPEGNADSTKKGYKGKPILTINIGKIGEFEGVMCNDSNLLSLLQVNLSRKKIQPSAKLKGKSKKPTSLAARFGFAKA